MLSYKYQPSIPLGLVNSNAILMSLHDVKDTSEPIFDIV